MLQHHYPHVPNYGDMTKYKEWNIEPNTVDLLVGGTPCQSFSVAGIRRGLADPRGNLMLTYGAIADYLRPTWIVWENVPGVLSSNGGKDFGAFIGMLGELGDGFAYRILDAQYYGVAQRRRRVFVVGYLGDWRRAAQVLFESESLCGHIAPSREKGERIAPTVTNGPPFSRTGNERVEAEAMVVMATGHTSSEICEGYTPTLTAHNKKKAPILCHGTQDPCVSKDVAFALGRNNGQENVLSYGIPGNWIGRQPENGGNAVEPMHNVAPCLTVADRHGVVINYSVRRLTPKECERLQGFPDDYTRISYRGKDRGQCPDGARYKAIGNSMAVPVMKWIGERIQEFS